MQPEDRDARLEQILLSLRDQVGNATAALRDEVRRGVEPMAASVAELRGRLDEVERAVERFGAAIAEQLTGAIDRAREEAPDVDELLAALRSEVARTVSEARDGAAGPMEELKRTVEGELAKLKEQVAYGMAALLRQIDAIRGSGPNAPSRLDRRRGDAPEEPAPEGPSDRVG